MKLILISFTIVIFITVLITSILLVRFIKTEKLFENKIYPNVYVNNVNFGNKERSEVVYYFSNLNNEFKKKNMTVEYKESSIATFSANLLNIRYDSEGIAERAYLIGRSSNFSSRVYQKLASILGWQDFRFDFIVSYDKDKLSDFLEEMKAKYETPAKNALFSFENGRVISFRKEEKGLMLEEDKFYKAVDKAVLDLVKDFQDKDVNLTVKVVEPEITLSKANDFGIEELIGEGKSDFSHSIPERIHNLTLATSKFNGVLIPKDSILSFNQTVGDISSLTGYKPAYIIKGGKTVLGDGGGVCQVSTTIFRAALNTGLPIVERIAHAYRVGYYENDSKPGFDATVFDPYADLKIKNDTPTSILIQTEIIQEKNLLYFRFYGKKDNRQIEISTVTIYDVVPPLPDLFQDDPTLKKGITKQMDFPAWGAKAVFDYKVTKDGKTTFEKKFFSSYRPWQAVYLVGKAD